VSRENGLSLLGRLDSGYSGDGPDLQEGPSDGSFGEHRAADTRLIFVGHILQVHHTNEGGEACYNRVTVTVTAVECDSVPLEAVTVTV